MRTQQTGILQMNIARDFHIRNSVQVCIAFQRKQCFAFRALRLKQYKKKKKKKNKNKQRKNRKTIPIAKCL